MENKPALQEPSKLPTIVELFSDEIEFAAKQEGLNAILNTPPPDKWLKEHPYIKVEKTDQMGNKVKVPYKYLPIDKVEYLLRKIFKKYSVKITGQGTAFNGVWVTVRVEYFSPATGEMESQDGVGAIHLQVKSGSSPADLQNINNGALSMAFPLAKTLAIKDACELIGNIFGANVSRNDTLQFSVDHDLLSNIKSNKDKLKDAGQG